MGHLGRGRGLNTEFDGLRRGCANDYEMVSVEGDGVLIVNLVVRCRIAYCGHVGGKDSPKAMASSALKVNPPRCLESSAQSIAENGKS